MCVIGPVKNDRLAADDCIGIRLILFSNLTFVNSFPLARTQWE